MSPLQSPPLSSSALRTASFPAKRIRPHFQPWWLHIFLDNTSSIDSLLLLVFLQPHKGPEVDGVEGGADHGDEASEYERGAQVSGRGHGGKGGGRASKGPARSVTRFPASRSRPGSEEAEQRSLPGSECWEESLGSEAEPGRKGT